MLWVYFATIVCFFFLGRTLNKFRKYIPFLPKDKSSEDCPILPNAQKKQIAKGLLWHGCHRGSTQSGPENTIEGFKQCLNEPISTKLLEFDVRLTKDKKIILLHDSMMDRTTNKKGSVTDMVLKDILEADAGYFHSTDGKSFPLRNKGIKVPLLKDLLDYIQQSSSTVNLMFDIKDINAIEPVFESISEYQLENRVILGSVDETSKYNRLAYYFETFTITLF